jgi:hypothetical protein
MGAPKGNRNAAKGRIWTQAIERALERRKSRGKQIKAIDMIADKLLDQAQAGDLQALKELGDRLEGKPTQQVELGGIPENPIRVQPWNLQPVKPAKE